MACGNVRVERSIFVVYTSIPVYRVSDRIYRSRLLWKLWSIVDPLAGISEGRPAICPNRVIETVPRKRYNKHKSLARELSGE
jgi:hypothetical protein